MDSARDHLPAPRVAVPRPRCVDRVDSSGVVEEGLHAMARLVAFTGDDRVCHPHDVRLGLADPAGRSRRGVRLRGEGGRRLGPGCADLVSERRFEAGDRRRRQAGLRLCVLEPDPVERADHERVADYVVLGYLADGLHWGGSSNVCSHSSRAVTQPRFGTRRNPRSDQRCIRTSA